jgi:hypothetical protein
MSRILAALVELMNARATFEARQRAAEARWQRMQATAAFRDRVAAMDEWQIRTECTRIQVACIAAERATAAAERGRHPSPNPKPPPAA